ncbi:hypothetical protein CgunFtcFv8_022531 [Champsocephalus gunnari]|uniref:C2H2-type domain-containing protein n=1 Tax=Champsocephalus gunnari TaxID=52237 RepID=A0AAN8DR28_CHAGU|nr:hypothetical protein CgunFtcFv8_022531 [Champsocephalus gunnari]
MDSPVTQLSVMCEVCGTYFETRKGLSSHARLHLRQLGVTLSESSGAPIELLYQLMQERGGSLPDFKGDSSETRATPPQKTTKQATGTPSAPEDSSDSFKSGSRVMTQKMDHRAGEGSSSSSGQQNPTKPKWAPLATDAPISLASDTKNEVHVCQLCGCWYGTRKSLSGHARTHLRQIGIPESDIKGSPIDLLYQIMEEEDFKPISSEGKPGGAHLKQPLHIHLLQTALDSITSIQQTDKTVGELDLYSVWGGV